MNRNILDPRLTNIQIMNPGITQNIPSYNFKIVRLMKDLTIILAFLAVCTTVFANNPNTGQTLQVIANSGLKMRLSPDLTGDVIAVIPYAEQVEILELPQKKDLMTSEYVSGEWLLVEYEGQTGYVFDGYLTNLPIPEYEFELNSNERYLIHSVESYADFRYLATKSPDSTSYKNGMTKVVQHYDNGNKMTKIYDGDYFKLELELEQARVMDAYHLILSMLPNDEIKEKLINETVFLADEEGITKRVNISIENPISIFRLPNGNIKMRIISEQEGC